ncbi:hypothetical protein EH183_21140 [Streptomyces sp. CB01881]|nr:hypothetical protein EH183_21140 [Streptomyces sp. CB01881]
MSSVLLSALARRSAPTRWSMPSDQKAAIVLSIPAGEITAAEAARSAGVTGQAISNWKRRFIEAGCGGLEATSDPQASREAELREEIARLKGALGDSYLQLQAIRQSMRLRPGPPAPPSAGAAGARRTRSARRVSTAWCRRSVPPPGPDGPVPALRCPRCGAGAVAFPARASGVAPEVGPGGSWRVLADRVAHPIIKGICSDSAPFWPIFFLFIIRQTLTLVNLFQNSSLRLPGAVSIGTIAFGDRSVPDREGGSREWEAACRAASCRLPDPAGHRRVDIGRRPALALGPRADQPALPARHHRLSDGPGTVDSVRT